MGAPGRNCSGWEDGEQAHGQWGLPPPSPSDGGERLGASREQPLCISLGVKARPRASDQMPKPFSPHRSGLCLLTDKTSRGYCGPGDPGQRRICAYPVPRELAAVTCSLVSLTPSLDAAGKFPGLLLIRREWGCGDWWGEGKAAPFP